MQWMLYAFLSKCSQCCTRFSVNAVKAVNVSRHAGALAATEIDKRLSDLLKVSKKMRNVLDVEEMFS